MTFCLFPLFLTLFQNIVFILAPEAAVCFHFTPLYLLLALFLSDGEKEAGIACSPCPLVLFVYLLMNYAGISPSRKPVHATARQTVHL